LAANQELPPWRESSPSATFNRVAEQQTERFGFARTTEPPPAPHRRGPHPDILVAQRQAQAMDGFRIIAGTEDLRRYTTNFKILVRQCQLNGQQVIVGRSSGKGLER
jgi:hypothetical protein